eukprot:c49641_g1_i1 orf=97-330(+)
MGTHCTLDSDNSSPDFERNEYLCIVQALDVPLNATHIQCTDYLVMYKDHFSSFNCECSDLDSHTRTGVFSLLGFVFS